MSLSDYERNDSEKTRLIDGNNARRPGAHWASEPTALPTQALDEDDIDPLNGWESPGVAAAPSTADDLAQDTPTVDATIARQPIPSSWLDEAVEAMPHECDRPDSWAPDSRACAPQKDRSPQPAPRAPQKGARHGCLSALLWIVMLVIFGFMALRCLPAAYANGKAVPELASFVPLMLIPAAVCLALAILWHRRVLIVVAAFALAVMGWWHKGYFIPTARVSGAAQAAAAATADPSDSVARIMTLNTRNGNADAQEIVALCRSRNVEVLCLQELSDGFADELSQAGIDELLPYHVVSLGASEVNNGGRNGIWTLAPMDNVSRNLLSIETSSMPAASIVVGDRTLRFVSVHPNSPVRGAQGLWASGLSVIESLAEYDHNYVIMGDFNSTWDHERLRSLLGDAFVDAGEQSGQGFHMTYPSSSKIPSLIEIDHIVYAKNAGVVVSDLDAVAISGSDHRARIATLEVQ